MIFWHVFKQSIQLPRKKAMFTLNRIGMDIVVFYMFILLCFVSIPSFIQQITQTNSYINDLNIVFQIIYFFIFFYLPLNLIVFSFLSLIAYIGIGLSKLMHRKLHYSILWKMCAFATTLPFIIYTIIALFYPLSISFLWLFILYTLILLIKMISIYPKRKVRPSNKK